MLSTVANAPDPPWLLPAICVVAIGGMSVLVFALIWFARRLVQMGNRSLKNAYNGLEIHALSQAGDVQLVFHTYLGFEGAGVQGEHRAFLSPEQALTLLRRLHRFNLHWGWFCPAGAFVPFLSYAEYRSQLKAIRAQTGGG